MSGSGSKYEDARESIDGSEFEDARTNFSKDVSYPSEWGPKIKKLQISFPNESETDIVNALTTNKGNITTTTSFLKRRARLMIANERLAAPAQPLIPRSETRKPKPSNEYEDLTTFAGKISDSKLKEVKDVEDQDKKDHDDYIADKLEQGYSMDRIQEKLGERKPGRARKMGLAASRWITGSKSPFAARTIARGALKKKKHKHTKKNKPRKKPRTTKPRPRKTKKPKFRSRARRDKFI